MRKRNLFLAGAVLLGTLVVPLSHAGTKTSAASKEPQSTGVSVVDVRPLPFSFEEILSYFDDAFEKPAYRVQNNTSVYVEGNAPDDSVVIAISAAERKIAVTLLANGDWGVNYIREFFEAPFFLRSESEQLYALLYANPGGRSATLGRFDVEIDVFETRNWIVVTAEFRASATCNSILLMPSS
jgi:hypothetical protein